ncbi:MAG: ATP synthase F1 subunit delta [Zetaproteobacteria bacterium CG_4_9_14_3_um_filter_49_83]|nr:MAG: ATP synthase F1 subunit delta [Zetaproteobacteria bacterium CG1_02_49_23]PIQ30064.1 MAG: ATP synthase F1 subunit delta [Zetaproteobacteria bacterium CG17_big_fil_post_rev_8_21_14_2_50_50_13]PIV29194.1 MAG: ATP synthase F1 subunit delta [Zetaproteobacteria bacterium CG02_land_8_20_14_3_00_50_9]PIY55988.1 MAG: ATP synthase F1 subunit delta [Zetaproteobacteria bacterium CG_4_10_14_0_8_um_filter_49_80]PJA36336.1 MAG: ATP synthase F1 subunit delta [Zetaproteobacteria bacterium CG_4_9_14_3_um
MSASSIARRYARAVFDLHQEGVNLSESLVIAKAVVEDKEAALVLLSPTCPDAVVAGVFTKVLEKAAGKAEVVRLCCMLAKRGKLILLPEIAEQFDNMVAGLKGEIDVEVTVAVKPKATLKKSLSDTLSLATGKKVNVNIQEDAGIIGGLIVSMGDRKLDYSLKSKLEGLRKTLAS